ncbi:DUF421 domain-containing protein [Fictibacillus aquaticus]|uniref:DUF421 domain-containing protein n=1 Tax=Fictibacillus aquaticus TaxID=2021314 RepID=A0A235F860_9BACL|nr:DUF421 domain-containing protein [Fictibacillus aquaticus]OYD57244.1 DUF421 domain-containing protein [Fictibacillus aquaticus]
MEQLLQSGARTAVSYLLLLLLTYFIGKQINSNKNYFNFALSITIGSLVANMGFNMRISFWPMLMSFVMLSLLYFLISYVSMHSRPLRKWLSGSPTVLIEKGEILEHNMKKIHYSLDDLNQQLRESGIFDIEEVEYAMLEISGNLSIMKKDRYKSVTKSDLHLPETPNQSLPRELIMDGRIIEKNFSHTHTYGWLIHEINSRGHSLDDVFYAVVSSSGRLVIDLYNDKKRV